MNDDSVNKKFDYDFFDGEDVPEQPQEQETPEQREEREIEELVVVSPRDRYRDLVLTISAAVVVLVIVALWWLFYHPVVSEAQVTGRLMEVRCEGLMFKTYEAGMVSEQFITDTIKRKDNDFNFSIDNDSLAYRLMRLQNTGKRIIVTYKQYTAPLPWRGKSDVIATGVVED
ncbi:MAG: hypothetical protein ACI4AH_03740 [Muribaculaceae bacterium]